MLFKKRPFQVELKGRSGIEYIEGDKRLILGSEFLAGDVGIVIYLRTLQNWNPPFSEETLKVEDKERIKRNVTEDLQKHNIPVEWA